MKSVTKLFVALFLMSSSVVAFAASYVDGIEYFKAGQPDRAKILLERTLNDNGTNKAESYYYLGEIAFDKKDYAAAADYYQKGLAEDPLFVYNTIGKGKLLLNQGDEKSAKTLFKEALKGNKKNAGVNLAIAKAYYATGKPGYQDYLNKAYKADKRFPDYFMFQGDMIADKKQEGYAGEAARQYEQALVFDPSCVEAYVKYANIYFPVSPDLAIAQLETLNELAPESALAQREMAEAYYKDEKYTKAAQAYEKYIQNPNHFETDRPRLATLLFYGKRYDESMKLANEILAKNPDNFVLRRVVMLNNYELANAKKGSYEAAEQAAVTFLGMNPGENEFTIRDYQTYGDILAKQKKYPEAIAQYEKAYAMDETRYDLLKVLSDAYDRNKDYVKAIDAFEKFMAADPEKHQTVMNHYLLGQIYYSAAQAAQEDVALSDQYLQKADTNFQVLVTKSPDDYRGYLWRARTASLKDPELKEGVAQPFYTELLAVLDKDAANKEKAATKRAYIEAYKYLGYLNYLQTTNLNAAKKKEAIENTKLYWNKMLELDPANTEIQEALKSLN